MATKHRNKVKHPAQISVRDVSREYGIKIPGNQDVPFSEYLKKSGSKYLGKALETMEHLKAV